MLTETSNNEQVRNFDAVIVYRGFLLEDLNNDIALLHLCEPVTFTDFVQPICLTKTWEDVDILDSYQDCWIAGWGNEAPDTDLPNRLQEAEVPLLSYEECWNIYLTGTTFQLPDGDICAGDSGASTCQGDSGGPLSCRGDDGRWHLVGIVSGGIGCGRLPSFFTRVSRYYSFIERNIRRHEECISPDLRCSNEVCGNPTCVLEEQRCDGVPHCPDGEDEIINC
ncbi:testisin-like [Amphiura filiformis]|uniref:testisin-like n=1 Tax=Amphiura filiformis TaxID=82378 RepID=UPI003B221FF7